MEQPRTAQGLGLGSPTSPGCCHSSKVPNARTSSATSSLSISLPPTVTGKLQGLCRARVLLAFSPWLLVCSPGDMSGVSLCVSIGKA